MASFIRDQGLFLRSCTHAPPHLPPALLKPPPRPTQAGLDPGCRLIGHHGNANSLHSTSWGLDHQGPPSLVAPLLDLPMLLMGTSPCLQARCSGIWQ